MKKRYQNFIFDLYGTLIDIQTDEEDPRLWKQLALYLRFRGGVSVHSGELHRDYLHLCDHFQQKKDASIQKKGLQGPGELDIRKVWKKWIREHGNAFSKTEIDDFCRLFRALSTRRLALYDGADEVLRLLHEKGKKVFLLTNAQSVFTRAEMRCLGIAERFDGILMSSDAGVKKPSPSLFRLLLETYGLDLSECLMIGNDDVCDCRGAALCGMDSLYVSTPQSPRRLHPLPTGCAEIASIHEVMAYS